MKSFALIIVLCVDVIIAGDWSYDGDTGPSNWATMYPEFCAGKSQSPINIVTSSVSCQSADITFYRYNYNLFRDLFSDVSITNNGHTAQVSGENIPGYIVTDFDAVQNKYNFLQYHYHWGPNSSVGSEHTVDGKSYPLELHLVHVNEKYVGTKEFAKQADGLAVVGVFFQISRLDNPMLTSVINQLKSIVTAGQSSRLGVNLNILDINLLPILNFNSLRQQLPADLSAYRYKGSLTTPTCNEVVNWIVLKNPITISERQLAQFRQLLDSHSKPITENYRPVLPLNGRQVCSAKGILMS